MTNTSKPLISTVHSMIFTGNLHWTKSSHATKQIIKKRSNLCDLLL